MKKVLLSFALMSMCLPGLGLAQQSTCWDCTLGIFDSDALTANYGTWDTGTSPTKKFYLGITYDPTSGYDGLSGVEFSIQGLPSAFSPSTVVLDGGFIIPAQPDSILAPPDTTAVGAQGGVNVTWTQCLTGNRALVEITAVNLDPIPNNTVIRVLRKFPPLSPEVPQVLFVACDFPIQTKVASRGGCYVLNPTVNPGETIDGCTLLGNPVSRSTWSTVKALYR